LTLAANIQWFARGVEKWTMLAEQKRDALPEGSEGKHKSKNFQAIPVAKGLGPCM
jgi:hypothetical protein